MSVVSNTDTIQTESLAGRAWRTVAGLPPSYFGLAMLFLAAWAVRPALLSPLLLLALLKQASALGVAALGQSLVMRARSIDLSIGGVVVIVVWIVTSGRIGLPVEGLVALAILAGALVGAINGLFITRLRVSAVIVTLAMSIVLTGIVVAASQYRQPGEVPELVQYFGSGRIGRFPVAALVWIGVLIPAIVILRYTVFGRFLDAIGDNPAAARLSGIPYLRMVFITHVASGVTAALAGLLLVGFVSVGTMNIGGDIVLNSLAAVTLGGVNFGSGKGRVMGPATGAFMLTFLLSFLISFGLDAAGKYVVQGVIIAAAALIYALRNR